VEILALREKDEERIAWKNERRFADAEKSSAGRLSWEISPGDARRARANPSGYRAAAFSIAPLVRYLRFHSYCWHRSESRDC
jgi:hypothetical protein